MGISYKFGTTQFKLCTQVYQIQMEGKFSIMGTKTQDTSYAQSEATHCVNEKKLTIKENKLKHTNNSGGTGTNNYQGYAHMH